jgi:hypothetical protein
MQNFRAIRRLIFVYFFLLIFEGSLRFWILPGFSNILLVVRDPVVCLIYLLAVSAGLMPRNVAIGLTVALAIFGAFSSLLTSEAPVLVTVFGLRSNYLHLPLIYVMQRVLSAADVLRIGRWLMWMMIPMAILVVQQFRTPQGALLNMGGMVTQYGTVRPAGTFSFVSGMICFSSLVAAFLAHSFASRLRKGLILKILCSLAVLSSLAVSGSRSSILAVGIVFIMLAGLSVVSTGAARGLLASIGVIGLALAGMTSTEFFEEGRRQLGKRFVDSAHGEDILGSSLSRVLGTFDYPIWEAQKAPLLGNGLGTGTNAGYFLTTGNRGFGGGQETELGRIMFESGAILGTIFILLRFNIALQMFLSGWRALDRGNLLPLLLFGAAGMNVVMGTWGIPTNQGFAIFGGGLCLAAIKVGKPRRRARSIAVLAQDSDVMSATPASALGPEISS